LISFSLDALQRSTAKKHCKEALHFISPFRSEQPDFSGQGNNLLY
jgi:hypothetical protein